MTPRFAVLGFGRIGRRITRLRPDVAAVLVRPRQREEAEALLPGVLVATELDAVLALSPRIVIEVAGVDLFRIAAEPILRSGADLIPLSLAAFTDEAFQARVRAIAAEGRGRVAIPPGSVGSLDALGAALESGLQAVTYRSVKPPHVYKTTVVRDRVDLDGLTERTLVFEGSARDAGRAFPHNCNVTVGVALAGLGLDRTRVELFADPAATRTTHAVLFQADAAQGMVEMTSRPLSEGSDPADMSTFSILRLLRRWQDPIFV